DANAGPLANAMQDFQTFPSQALEGIWTRSRFESPSAHQPHSARRQEIRRARNHHFVFHRTRPSNDGESFWTDGSPSISDFGFRISDFNIGVIFVHLAAG